MSTHYVQILIPLCQPIVFKLLSHYVNHTTTVPLCQPTYEGLPLLTHFTVITASGYTSISFVLRGVLPPVAFWHLTAALTQEVALVFLCGGGEGGGVWV